MIRSPLPRIPSPPSCDRSSHRKDVRKYRKGVAKRRKVGVEQGNEKKEGRGRESRKKERNEV